MMRIISSLLLAALLGLGTAQSQGRLGGPAQSLTGPLAVGDNEITLYRFTGVRDNGGLTNLGVATVFHCTNSAE